MVIPKPSDEFLILVHTLLESLGSPTDATFLQLHAIFGPMLVSAMQLVDRREVVLVSLPGGRSVYQVTSSTGRPYTLYLDLPSRKSTNQSEAFSKSLTDFVDLDKSLHNAAQSSSDSSSTDQPVKSQGEEDSIRKDLLSISRLYAHLYCPCIGFTFNSLSGERNILCKHLLAVLIAHWTRRVVHSQVSMSGVVDLLWPL